MFSQESPHLYGLHPNAEIGFLTATSEKLFKTVFELQPRESGSGGGATSTREEKVKTTITLLPISIIVLSIKVKTIVDDISEKMPDQFNMHDIMAKCEERTPYIIVCFQVKQIPPCCTNTVMFGGCQFVKFFLGYQPSKIHSDLENRGKTADK